jgi:hypothetical protein
VAGRETRTDVQVLELGLSPLLNQGGLWYIDRSKG